jgi:hypothetical protein
VPPEATMGWTAAVRGTLATIILTCVHVKEHRGIHESRDIADRGQYRASLSSSDTLRAARALDLLRSNLSGYQIVDQRPEARGIKVHLLAICNRLVLR